MLSSRYELKDRDHGRGLGCFAVIQVLLFGIALPIWALVVEAHEHPSRELFLDPIPSGAHFGLIAMVPLVMA
ncbi:hypothetical protein IV102_27495 [bacterium]|nr:hypothetical protein [bacterium]